MSYCRAWIVCLTALFAVGCGGSKVPVSGTITYKGEAVKDSTVIFTPAGKGDAAGKSARGTTDAQGKFSLTTDQPNDGAVPGDYTVSVIPKAVTRAEGDYSADPPPPFPAKYTNATGSDLKATVKTGTDNQIPLELKD